jgi:ATP-dependent RNA helicase DDX59
MFVPRSVVRRPKIFKKTANKTLKQKNVPFHESHSDPSLSTASCSVDTSQIDSHTPQPSSSEPPHLSVGDELRAPLEQSVGGDHESDSHDSEGGCSDDEPVLSFSKQQRWPDPGEPVCVVCGRYGAYIVDRTDDDICSLECKAKRLMKLGIHVTLDRESRSADSKEEEVGDGSWLYREHPEVTAMTTEQCSSLYKQVRSLHFVVYL